VVLPVRRGPRLGAMTRRHDRGMGLDGSGRVCSERSRGLPGARVGRYGTGPEASGPAVRLHGTLSQFLFFWLSYNRRGRSPSVRPRPCRSRAPGARSLGAWPSPPASGSLSDLVVAGGAVVHRPDAPAGRHSWWFFLIALFCTLICWCFACRSEIGTRKPGTSVAAPLLFLATGLTY